MKTPQQAKEYITDLEATIERLEGQFKAETSINACRTIRSAINAVRAQIEGIKWVIE